MVVITKMQRQPDEGPVAELKGLTANWTKLLSKLESAEQQCERIATLTKARAEAARQALDSARRSAAADRLDLLRRLGVLAAGDPAVAQALLGVKSLSPYPSTAVASAVVDLLEQAQQSHRRPASSAAPEQAPESDSSEDPAQGPPGDLLTVKQVEAWTQIDAKTLYGYVNKGLIPYVKIQFSVRFRRKDIVAWLERQSFRPS